MTSDFFVLFEELFAPVGIAEVLDQIIDILRHFAAPQNLVAIGQERTYRTAFL